MSSYLVREHGVMDEQYFPQLKDWKMLVASGKVADEVTAGEQEYYQERKNLLSK